ncbi:NAD(P)/FAD-dependent oxidoreductase [Zavarzinia compransoris]|uniref:NAD/FAD-binding protein n=1 Tax=Zavarzinia compransoris TaxID=1264899 RepID=A0A317E870_9PROT|nr:FAD-dependent oxidoreductase [Zavarzinia compransoris]PWR23338.1 NAD/FAD-binding protein [Zavarzinia compransoris]TDP46088.1 putative NAD/FAD-binding protein [Zavarzinia compransoris]
MTERKRIAVIGTGITGLAAAWLLRERHDVTVYEKDGRPGGHAHTVTIDYDGTAIPVDTGFIVYNEVNYPHLTRLFAALGVATRDSSMSFAVSARDGRLEWAGDTLATVFAQKRNLARPRFLGMLRDILRFNRNAAADLAAGRLDGRSLGDYIAEGRYGAAFRDDYLLPMGAAIWSTPVADMSAFPAASFIRFFDNHALLRGLEERHPWRTVEGGSIRYVQAIAAALGPRLRLSCPALRVARDAFGATVVDGRGGCDRFDAVILACHGDQALALIEAPSAAEARVLGAFRYTANHAVLHRDPALMPRRRKVWSSWNYLSGAGGGKVALTYWMNRLQGIDGATPVFVSLNPHRAVRDDLVFGRYDYAHPMFDAAAIAAQREIPSLQGRDRLWFAGSYCGNGFHEDGLKAAIDVAAAFGVAPAWAPGRQAAAE